MESLAIWINEIKTAVYLNSRNLVALAQPRPVSTTTDRKYHQETFKNDLISYYNCRDPTYPNTIKCMVLGHYFNAVDVTAGRILGLTQSQSLNILGLTSKDVWNCKNGILWHSEIEKKYSSQEIVNKIFYFIAFICQVNLSHRS